MKLEQIFELWEVDSKIDIAELQFESLKIPQLHFKYYKIYIGEKSLLSKLRTNHSQLKLEKTEFLTQGPTEETDAKGWKLPPKGRVIKSEIEIYLQADKDLIDIALKIQLQEEKIELLKSILDTIKQRSFHIREAIEFLKFQNGQ